MVSLKFLALAGLCGLASAASYTNPLKRPNGSDPFLVWHGGYYYLTTTTWNDVQITRAKTLNGLKTGENKVIIKDSNASRCCNVWAPEFHFLDGAWYLYYSAGTQDVNNQHVHVAKGGASPWDAFIYVGVLTPDWSIDSTVAKIGGSNYLIWSCWRGGINGGNLQSNCIAKLETPTKIGQDYLLSEPTESWERIVNPTNEGAAALYHGDKIYIAYSASHCTSPNYQLGLLTWTGGDPLQRSSWKKSGPVFSQANGNYGTAHNAFFKSPDGTEDWIIYHGTSNAGGNCDGARYTMAHKITWNADGTPNFGKPPALSTSLTGPSGE